MNLIFTLENYLMLNVALVIGYLISRATLKLSLFDDRILQSYRLKFARYTFISTILIFYFAAHVQYLLPEQDSGYMLMPIIKTASASLVHANNILGKQIASVSDVHTLPSISGIIQVLLALGVSLFICKYIGNMIHLRKVASHCFTHHKIKNIHVLISSTEVAPYCWSFFNKHYVVMPAILLEKRGDFNLAMRHELQHIRQSDTQWLHLLAIVKALCFWNPVMQFWGKFFDELQEFSCDEGVMLRKKTPASAYAQCLVDTAAGIVHSTATPKGALGIHGISTSLLYRRVNMLFDYTSTKTKKLPLLIAYAVTIAITATTSMAFASSTAWAPLSAGEVSALIKQSKLDNEFNVSANKDVVGEINNIRSSKQARSYIQAALQRMATHQSLIAAELKKRDMPNNLLVVPLVESGYQSLPENINPVKAAGIWQIIPGTAARYGLKMDKGSDQRMDDLAATQAALQLLSDNFKIYKNWKLAFVAYEIGNSETDKLIKETGSHDAWVLATSAHAPKTLKKSLAMFDADLVIMHNPALVSKS